MSHGLFVCLPSRFSSKEFVLGQDSQSQELRLPVTAAHDGWEVTSASAGPQPTKEQLVERLGGPAADKTTDTTAVAAAAKPGEEETTVVVDKPVAGAAAAAKPGDAAAAVVAKPGEKATTDKTGDKPRGGSMQSRINEQTRLRYQAERDLAAERTRTEELTRELAAVRTKPADGAAATEAAALAAAAAAKPAAPVEPKESDFHTYEEYQSALRAFDRAVITAETNERIATALATRDASTAAASTQDRLARVHVQRVEKFNERLDTLRASMPDLDAIMDRPIPMSAPMRDIIMDSEVGPQIWVHLDANPGEAERIARLHPLIAIREMGRIEERLSAGAHSGPSASSSPVSQARPIVKPAIGPAASAAAGRTTDLASMAFGPEWIAESNRQRSARGRRR